MVGFTLRKSNGAANEHRPLISNDAQSPHSSSSYHLANGKSGTGDDMTAALIKNDAAAFDGFESATSNEPTATIQQTHWGRSLLPGPPWLRNIIVTESCERYSFYGLRAILVLYLTTKLDYTRDQATAASLYSSSLAYFMPLLGGYISDSYLGKYATIIYFALLYCVGGCTLALTSFDPSNVGCIVALILIGIGTGGIKPCVSAFGADQFSGEYGRQVPRQQLEKEVSQFFGVFYFAINFGSICSYIFTPLFRNYVGFPLAFGVPAIFLFVATIIFWTGRNQYYRLPPQGSVLYPVYKTFQKAIAHRNDESTEEQVVAAKAAYIPLWLYRAVGHDNLTASDAANAGALWRVMPVFAMMPIFWSLFDQTGNEWILQAKEMNLYGLQPEQLNIANPLSVMILIPFMQKVVYPFAERRNMGLTVFRRMGIGMLLTGLAFLMSAAVQAYIDANEPNTVNVFLQLPQFFVLTWGEVLISVTGLEFAYTQAPAAMKSLLTAFWLVTVSVGDLLAGAIFQGLSGTLSHVQLQTLFATLMFVNFFVFLIIAYRFQPVPAQVYQADDLQNHDNNPANHNENNS